MDQNDNRLHRLRALVAFLLVVLVLYTGVLFNAQVNDHDYYLSQSIRSIARKENVVASRGIITDRSGRPMVSNRSTYALTFDTELLRKGDDENTAILRLVQLCRSQNIPWVDTLPITRELPFTFTLDQATPSQKKSFLTYLKSLSQFTVPMREYLLEHPEAVGQEILDTYLNEHDEQDSLYQFLQASGDDAHSLKEDVLKQSARSLLKLLDAEHLTSDLLVSAGFSSPLILSWMQEDFELSPEFTLEEARLILGVQYELSWRRLDNHSASYVMAEEISTPFITMLSDGSYSGARVIPSYVREYETKYAAHILGTVGPLYKEDKENPMFEDYPGNAIVGKSGVEYAFEPYLQGKNGVRVVSTNPDGKVTGEYYSKEPQPGNTVELTIDLPFQQAVEGALDHTISTMNKKNPDLGAVGGAAVVKVGTGEVLALASYPTYDPSTYRQDYKELSNVEKRPDRPLYNRATQGRYPPGSTLKPLTSIAALESGIITPKEKINCPVTWYYPGDSNSRINCWLRSRPHGKLNVSEAITASCNYFFAEMGYRLGMDRLVEYMSAFGFGEPTGIEIGDNAGSLPHNKAGENQAPWAAMGQSNMVVTPLQLANYIATLVSGGQHYETHLLKAVKSYDNSEIVALGNTTPVNTISIAPANLDAVKEGMHGLTKGTLAPYFNSCIVEAGAKTGTAQLGYGKENNGVFVCFAPYDDPEIAVAIAIEKGGAGAALASTAVSILNAYFSANVSESAITGDHQLLQ